MPKLTPEAEFIEWMADNFPAIKVRDVRETLYKKPERKGYPTTDFDRRVGVCFHQALVYAQSWDAVSKYHTRTWDSAPGIAYTMGIDLNGVINIFWDFNRRCYSQGDAKIAGDENVKWLGVVLNGKLRHKDVPDGGEPTLEQMLSMLAIVKHFREKYDWNYTTGHFNFHKSACPGGAIERIVRAIRFNEMLSNKNETNFRDFCSIMKNRQLLLKELGHYKGVIDNIWGNQSKHALEEFQSQYGLFVDGIWGSQVETKLYEVVVAKGIFPK